MKILKIAMPLLLTVCVASAAEFEVIQKGKLFEPTTIDAKVGDVIKFKNADPFAHNAFSEDGENEFDIGMQAPGEDYTITLKAAGTVNVECAIHPSMQLKITVN